MRARTVGDLRRELDGVEDGMPLSVEMPDVYIGHDGVDEPELRFDRSGTRLDTISGGPLDVERVEVTTGRVVLHVDGDLP